MMQRPSSSFFYRLLCLSMGLLIGISPLGAEPKPLQNGPVHEALISQATVPVPLEALPVPPPAPLVEKVPAQQTPQAKWIGGYWAWVPLIKDFVWVSGFWRCPPPGKQWVAGGWKEYEEGWVWLRGFWSDLPETDLIYIGTAPPDPLDENADGPPSSNYFWAPGYWHYASQTGTYEWISGHWEEFHPEWVYVPAHYVWRPGGYVFIGGYWDWAGLGCEPLYVSLLIPEKERKDSVVESFFAWEPHLILQQLVVNYPNYASFFEHHYHFHPDFWSTCYCSPPWWGWDTWWSHSWQDLWALWWWYTHPGYPQPSWLNAEMIAMILPPSQQLLILMKNHAEPPSIVTPKGVVPPSKLRKAVEEAMASDDEKTKAFPIIPAKKNVLEKIQKRVEPTSPSEILRPAGNQKTVEQLLKNPPLKALVNADREDEEAHGRGKFIQLPEKPVLSPAMKPQQKTMQDLKPLKEREKQDLPTPQEPAKEGTSLNIPRSMKQPPAAAPSLKNLNLPIQPSSQVGPSVASPMPSSSVKALKGSVPSIQSRSARVSTQPQAQRPSSPPSPALQLSPSDLVHPLPQQKPLPSENSALQLSKGNLSQPISGARSVGVVSLQHDMLITQNGPLLPNQVNMNGEVPSPSNEEPLSVLSKGAEEKNGSSGRLKERNKKRIVGSKSKQYNLSQKGPYIEKPSIGLY